MKIVIILLIIITLLLAYVVVKLTAKKETAVPADKATHSESASASNTVSLYK